MRFTAGLEGSSYTNLCATEVLHNTSQADRASLGRNSRREQYIYPVRAHPFDFDQPICLLCKNWMDWRVCGDLSFGRDEYSLQYSSLGKSSAWCQIDPDLQLADARKLELELS